MTELWGWVIGALAAVCATLFATADSALLAMHSPDGSANTGPAFAEQERLHRALSMARVAAYVAVGASLAQSLHVATAPTTTQIILIALIAGAACVIAEGTGRTIGPAKSQATLDRFAPLTRTVGIVLSPAVALGAA